jgi:hypothetical protein
MYKTKKLVVENIKKEKTPKASRLTYKEERPLDEKFWVIGAIKRSKEVINNKERLNKSV